MATYSYEDTSGRRKGGAVEKVVWVIMGAMIAFGLLCTFHPAVKAVISKSHGSFTVGFVIVYLMFLIFTRRIFRKQKLGNMKMVTNRRGFTFNDVGGEKILSWRDVRSAEAWIDVDARGHAFIRRLTLQWAKRCIRVENDPCFLMPHMARLVREVRERVPDLRFSFHYYHAICPFCKGTLARKAPNCPSCGVPVRYASKIMRPWEMIREENFYIFLLMIVAGPNFYPLALVFAAGLVFITILVNTRSRLKPLMLEDPTPTSQPAETSDAPEPAPVPRTPSPVALTVLGLLLLVTGTEVALAAPPSDGGRVMLPSPAALPPSPTAVPSPSPFPSPRTSASDAAYFPLAVGNTWEYRSSYDTVTVKVTGKEIVNGAACYVVESYVGDNSESVQREYFAMGPGGVEVHKRSHKGSEFFLEVPEPMITFPLVEGRHWTWQGNASQGNVMLVFSVMGMRRIPVLGHEKPGMLILVRGRSSDGTEIQTKRWYCRGIGMVREQTMMKKAGRATTVEATLQNYSLRVP